MNTVPVGLLIIFIIIVIILIIFGLIRLYNLIEKSL